MERIFLFVVVLVLADGFELADAQKDHNMKQMVCDKTHNDLTNKFIEKSMCRPKESFVPLTLSESYLELSPSSVFVNRCLGICDFSGNPEASVCTPVKTSIEPIRVRVYNLKTNKGSCNQLEVEVHEECRCCSKSGTDCA